MTKSPWMAMVHVVHVVGGGDRKASFLVDGSIEKGSVVRRGKRSLLLVSQAFFPTPWVFFQSSIMEASHVPLRSVCESGVE